MPKHIVRLLLLIGAVAVVGIGVRSHFIDKSFGVYGHYRADAVPEIAADTPIYKGAAYCQKCHGERYAQWKAGIHNVVNCETCHGAAAKHPGIKPPPVASDARTQTLIAAARFEHVRLSIPSDTVKLCTLCHEKMAGRPAAQPQIDVKSHAGGQACIVCHDPHSPKIVASAAPQAVSAGDLAAAKEKAAACAACHGEHGMSGNPEWPNLAGQQSGYLAGALQAYKSGARRDAMMTDMAKDLSEPEINALAAYYASLSCESAPTKPAAAAASAGAEKAARCATCHGAQGVSASPAWPSLAGQQKDYLVNALKAYQTGARQNPMMAGMVKGTSEAEIGQLAAYFAGLKCK
jgi:cytochrome c553